jgi:hypothetical protein
MLMLMDTMLLQQAAVPLQVSDTQQQRELQAIATITALLFIPALQNHAALHSMTTVTDKSTKVA